MNKKHDFKVIRHPFASWRKFEQELGQASDAGWEVFEFEVSESVEESFLNALLRKEKETPRRFLEWEDPA